jgi:hypothetical protein
VRCVFSRCLRQECRSRLYHVCKLALSPYRMPYTREAAVVYQPTLTQTQIIRALADALSWFEREIAWGVSPQELRALTGRIGELYAAMITRGQMALSPNQRGYDVVSAQGERISVKTITTSNQIQFSATTFNEVDRVIILRVNVDPDEGISIEELLDRSASEARALCREGRDALHFRPAGQSPRSGHGDDLSALRITSRAQDGEHEIVRYENGAVRILRDGAVQDINVKGHLRPVAARLGVPIESEAGYPYTTQQLGAAVIRALNEAHEVEWDARSHSAT